MRRSVRTCPGSTTGSAPLKTQVGDGCAYAETKRSKTMQKECALRKKQRNGRGGTSNGEQWEHSGSTVKTQIESCDGGRKPYSKKGERACAAADEQRGKSSRVRRHRHSMYVQPRNDQERAESVTGEPNRQIYPRTERLSDTATQ